jgi:hypothetical protein
MFWIPVLLTLFVAYFVNANQDEKLKIILVGLPKCGTTSFHQFLRKLSYKSAHFRAPGVVAGRAIVGELILRAKSEGLPMLHYLGQFDAITEMAKAGKPVYDRACYFPQAEDLETLFDQNQDALFILNSRDVGKHAKSMSMFPYYGKFLQYFCPDYLPGNATMTFLDRYHQFISEHNQRVREFFASRPESKFIEFKIEDGDTSLFKPYFDPGNELFPHSYKSPHIV